MPFHSLRITQYKFPSSSLLLRLKFLVCLQIVNSFCILFPDSTFHLRNDINAED